MADINAQINSLSAKQKKLVEIYLKKKNISEAANDYNAIERAEEKEYYGMSPAQKRLFILDRIVGANITYNIPVIYEIEGALEKEKFEETFRKIIGRHETLRTSFYIMDNTSVQKVSKTVEFGIEYLEAAAGKVKELAESFVRPFDLSTAPLLRVELIKTGDNRHIMLFDMHHIISDGVSMGILIKEFMELYDGKELPGLRVQYKDYSEWQKMRMQTGKMKKAEAYWINRFGGEIPVLNMPYDYKRPVVQGFEGNVVTFKVGKETVQRLREVLKAHEATMYMGLLSVFNILLMKYSGQEDVVVGSPVAGRGHADLRCIIGMFVNTLAMRNMPGGNKRYIDFLKEVKENALQAFENQDYQFEDLVEKVVTRRDLGRNPLFDAMFVLQNMELGEIGITGLKLKPYEIGHKTAKLDLSLYAIEGEEEICFYLEYSTRLFKKETIERMVGHFKSILEEVLDNPHGRLCDIEMLTGEEKHQILFDYNDTNAEYPKDKTVHQLFEEQAERIPGKIAVVYEDGQLTYGELNGKSNQLARLLREKGVKPGSIVGIMAERSPGMIIGIMGILKAGSAYLPIDPDYPADRIKYMLEDSGTMLLLLQGKLKAGSGTGREIIDLDDNSIYTGESTNPVQVNTQDDPAYVIYTSGSTGKPKGVIIKQAGVVNVLTALERSYPVEKNDAYLLKTNYTFDVSVAELFGWFMGSGKMVILKPGDEKDTGKIMECIKKEGITHINFVPSLLDVLLNNLSGSDTAVWGKLKYVFAAGEALRPGTVNKFYSLVKGVKLENLYGPTESTVYTTMYSINKAEEIKSVPIGKPISNINVYIVDKYKKLQPIGIPGELCISGDGLAREYLNQPEQTAEKFVDNPFVPGQRMYRTGDLARWLPDGNIEFLGRMDYQVKIRGFRIELGEIESHLLKHNEISKAVVIARDDKDGNKYLCAYLVSGRELTATGLRSYLAGKLPGYMIPACFVRLENLPLNANGKIDRKALPVNADRLTVGTEYAAPGNEAEEKLCRIWQDVLEIKRVGINDNFFDLGGHSLSALKVISHVKQMFGIELPLQVMFTKPTICELAASLEQASLSVIPIPSVPLDMPVQDNPQTFSFDQQQLWFQSRLAERDAFCNILLVVRLTGTLDLAVLRDSFAAIARKSGTSVMAMFGAGTLKIVDLQAAPENRQDVQLSQLIVEEALHPFESKGAMVRVILFQEAAAVNVLMFIMRPDISDGFSGGIFIKQFVSVYQTPVQEKSCQAGATAAIPHNEYNEKDIPANRPQIGKEIKLHLETPPIAGYLHHAYHLAVAQEHPSFLKWFNSRYIQLKFYPGTNWLNFYRIEVGSGVDYCPLLEYLVIKNTLMIKSKMDIIGFIINALEDGYFVWVFIDEYYDPNRKVYHNRHLTHESLLYGYDPGADCFYSVGFDQKQNFAFSGIQAADLLLAFHNAEGEPPLKLVRPDKAVSCEFDIENAKNILKDYIHSENTSIRHRMYNAPTSDCIYGVDIYGYLKLYLENLLKTIFPCDIRILHIFWEHKKCMLSRIKYLHENGYLQYYDPVLDTYNEIERKTLTLRNQQFEYNLSGNAGVIKKMLAALDEIKDNEIMVLSKLLDCLK